MQTSKLPPNPKIRITTIFNQLFNSPARTFAFAENHDKLSSEKKERRRLGLPARSCFFLLTLLHS